MNSVGLIGGCLVLGQEVLIARFNCSFSISRLGPVAAVDRVGPSIVAAVTDCTGVAMLRTTNKTL